MRLLGILISISAVLLSAACGGGGKPSVYLTLAATPAGGEASNRETSGPPISVERVEIAPELDRTLFTTAAGTATLQVEGNVHWAAPLSALARQALARDLADRLPGASVLMPGDPNPPGKARRVHVNLLEFRPDASGRVTLEADWSAETSEQVPPKTGRFHLQIPGGANPSAEAATMSEALGRLADTIAQAY